MYFFFFLRVGAFAPFKKQRQQNSWTEAAVIAELTPPPPKLGFQILLLGSRLSLHTVLVLQLLALPVPETGNHQLYLGSLVC